MGRVPTLLALVCLAVPSRHRLSAEITPTPGTVDEWPAGERLYVLVLPAPGVHWDDLGDPERVLARDRPRAMSPTIFEAAMPDSRIPKYGPGDGSDLTLPA